MKAKDPKNPGIWKYFIGKCLPFGSSISCSHFQRFSDTLHHIMEWRVNVKNRITNYLDDYLFIARTIAYCNFMINEFLCLCQELGVPVSLDKTEWAAEIIVFLGILLDGCNMILAIPIQKKQRAIELLQETINKKKVMVKHLQKMCGFLNFLCKAIVPGRTFIHQMYAKYSNIINVNKSTNDKSHNPYAYKFKQHYHIRPDVEFKLDCQIWLQFLQGQMGAVVNRPMTDFSFRILL